MSYPDECPDLHKARREGERAGYRGWGTNPYTERHRENRDQTYCEDAEVAWRRGRWSGEERRQEEEHEEYMQRVAAEERAMEEAYWEQQHG